MARYYHNVVTGATQWHAPPEWAENVADDYVWGSEHELLGEQGEQHHHDDGWGYWEHAGGDTSDALVPYNSSAQAAFDPLGDDGQGDSLSTLEASLDMGQYSPRPNAATALTAASYTSPEAHVWVLCDDNSAFEYFWNSTSDESSWEAPEIGWLQRVRCCLMTCCVDQVTCSVPLDKSAKRARLLTRSRRRPRLHCVVCFVLELTTERPRWKHLLPEPANPRNELGPAGAGVCHREWGQ